MKKSITVSVIDSSHHCGLHTQGTARYLAFRSKSQSGNPSRELHQAEAIDTKGCMLQSRKVAYKVISGRTSGTDNKNLSGIRKSRQKLGCSR